MKAVRMALYQMDMIWENPQANLDKVQAVLEQLSDGVHVLVLPEMFSTGFSMAPQAWAHEWSGSYIQQLQALAVKYRKVITGSLMVKDGHQYFNRMIWLLPNGASHYYNKRHLFSYAGEHQHYQAGDQRVIVQVNGWKILLITCYDLRFPVWIRQQKERYDAFICVANWPDKRAHAWRTLVQARAIENMAYGIGVNRTGEDGYGHMYSGYTAFVNPLGEVINEIVKEERVIEVELNPSVLKETRDHLPFLDDADQFIIT
jgi:omega-amidase